jgi:predicted transcriptional regulator
MALVLSSQVRQTTVRRSAFEVMMAIMKVTAAGSAKPTHIMYKSNTSWIVLQKNLDSLVASGFMTQSGEGARLEYAITPRGLEVLQDYNKLIDRTASYPVEARQ